jgi:DNA-binding CsgD family transcriptional regulator
MTSRPSRRMALILAALIGVQALCATFFLTDAISDYQATGFDLFSGWHLTIEALATVSIILAMVFETLELRRMLTLHTQMQRSLSVAAGALHEVMLGYFRDWGLTQSEQDVAAFMIKGADIAEIARLRGTATGTVKAHLHGIYRKSGVTGRAGLVSVLVDDLLSAPIDLAVPKTGLSADHRAVTLENVRVLT